MRGAQATLNMYAQKTQGEVVDAIPLHKDADGNWVATLELRYASNSDAARRGDGRAPGKKVARKLAAESIMQQLSSTLLQGSSELEGTTQPCAAVHV